MSWRRALVASPDARPPREPCGPFRSSRCSPAPCALHPRETCPGSAMYVWSCPNCMPRWPRREHTSEEVEVAQREVPGARIRVEPLSRPQHLADEADLPVRRQEAGAQERAPLRTRRQGDQRVRVDLGGGAAQEGDALG